MKYFLSLSMILFMLLTACIKNGNSSSGKPEILKHFKANYLGNTGQVVELGFSQSAERGYLLVRDVSMHSSGVKFYIFNTKDYAVIDQYYEGVKYSEDLQEFLDNEKNALLKLKKTVEQKLGALGSDKSKTKF